MEDGNGATIPDTTGTLDGATAPGPDPLVQSRQGVEVEAGKVQFPQVPGIVHVPDEDVHVLGGAQAEDRGRVRDLALALEESAREDGEHTADEVVHIPDDVQNQQNHQPRHRYCGLCFWKHGGGKPVIESESFSRKQIINLHDTFQEKKNMIYTLRYIHIPSWNLFR